MQKNKRPNFIIIGAEKCGTTSLYHYLNQHPEVYMSPEKEPCYYIFKNGTPSILGSEINKDVFLRTRIKNEQEYSKQFEGVNMQKAIGEASASYIYVKEAAENINNELPNAKLIVVLRNPVERAYSNFLHCIRRGVEPLRDFNEYVQSHVEQTRIKNKVGLVLYYIEKGFYFKYLSEYFQLMNKENIKVIVYDELKQNPEKVVETIFNFLGLNQSFKIDVSEHHNVSEKKGLQKNALTDLYKSRSPLMFKIKNWIPRSMGKSVANLLNKNFREDIPQMTDETKTILKSTFLADIENLERLIDKDLSGWK